MIGFSRTDPFGTPFALDKMERIARRGRLREWPREGSGIDRPHLVGSGVVIEISTRVINHEERQTCSASCLVDPTSTSSGNQPGRPETAADSHAIRTIRRGSGRTARLDRAAEGVFLVPPAWPPGTSSLGLQRAAQRDLPVRRMPRLGRRDGRASSQCLGFQQA